MEAEVKHPPEVGEQSDHPLPGDDGPLPHYSPDMRMTDLAPHQRGDSVHDTPFIFSDNVERHRSVVDQEAEMGETKVAEILAEADRHFTEERYNAAAITLLSIRTCDQCTQKEIAAKLAGCYTMMKDFDAALLHYRRELECAINLADDRARIVAHSNLAMVHRLSGQFEKAVAESETQCRLAAALSEQEWISDGLINIAKIRQQQAKMSDDPEPLLKAAISAAEDNLNLTERSRDPHNLEAALALLASLNFLVGDLEQAIRFHIERLTVVQQLSDDGACLRSAHNIAHCLIHLTKYEEAIPFYEESLHRAELLGETALQARAHYSLGNTFLLLSHYPLAVQHYEDHLKLALQLRDVSGQRKCCGHLAHTYLQLGDKNLSSYYSQQEVTLQKSHRSPQTHSDSHSLTSSESVGFVCVHTSRGSRSQPALRRCRSATRSHHGSLPRPQKPPNTTDDMFDLIVRAQSRQLFEQRVSLPTVRRPIQAPVVGRTLEEENFSNSTSSMRSSKGACDELAATMKRLQLGRLDEQRVALAPLMANNTLPHTDTDLKRGKSRWKLLGFKKK